MTDYNTNPTIETVLERIEALGMEMRAGFAAINTRLDRLEAKLDRLNGRLLDIEGTSDMHDKRIASLEDRT
jgi:hypothetical protein